MDLSMKREYFSCLVITGGLVVLVLVVLTVVFAFRANSDACQQGFKLQSESQLLEKKLKKSQESFKKMEAQWQSCGNVTRDLKKNLEKVTSNRDSLLLQLQELKGENQDLTEKLKKAEVALQLEREKNHSNVTSSALSGPRIYSLVLGLGLVITLLL